MAQIETWLNQEMTQAVKVRYLDGNLFSMDNAGNLIGVKLTKDGEDYSGGGTVSANVIRSDGGTVAVSGALSGNVATVVLPQAAYAIPGVVSIVMKLTVSGEVTTIAAVVANVYESTTSTTVDPGTIIPSIQTLISQINTAVASIPADYSSLWSSLAPAFSTSTAYAVGDYCTYNGVLYRFTSAHAAGSWSASDVSAAVICNDLMDLKKQVNNIYDLQTETSIKPASTDAGGIYYSNGNDHNSSSALASYVRTGYILVSKGDTLKFTGIRQYSSYAVVAFYDESKTYDQTLSIAGTYIAGQSGSIQFTKNGYVRLSCTATSWTNAVFKIINAIGQAESALSDRISNIEASIEESLGLSGVSWEIGSITTSGNITSSTVRIRSEYIPTNFTAVKFTITSGYRFAAVWYNTSKTFLRDDYWNTEDITIEPPDGAAYLRLVVGKVEEETASLDYADEISAIGTISIVDLKSSVELLSKNQIPDYWREYMAEKYPVLWAKDALIGSGGDSFVFITDVHYERNKLNSPALINGVVKNTAVKTVFCGGDMIDLQTTASDAIAKLETWQGMMYGMRVFNIVGNHDNNNYNSSQAAEGLTKGQYYGVMIKPEEQWINTNGELYYCVDNDSQKIRYICLAIECFDNVGTSGTQRTWLQSKLTEKDSSWTILVIQHRIWGSSTASIDTKAQNVINAINEIWSSINAKFIGIIAGHTHLDYNATESTKGYHLIAVNCDANTGNNSGYTRTAGTTTEQSFDVFYIDKTNEKLYAVRIGAGDDSVGSGTGIREFSY